MSINATRSEGNIDFLDVPTDIFFDFIKNYKQ